MTEEEAPKSVDPGAVLRADVEAAANTPPSVEIASVAVPAETGAAPEIRPEAVPPGPTTLEAGALEASLSPENRNRFSGLSDEERSLIGRAWNSVRDAVDDRVTTRIKLWGSRMISEFLSRRASSGIEKATKLRNQAVSEAANIARELEQAREDGLLAMNPELEDKVKGERATAESRGEERAKEIERLEGVRAEHQERHQELVGEVTARWEAKVTHNQKEIDVRSENLRDVKVDISRIEVDLKSVNEAVKKYKERINSSTSAALKEAYLKEVGLLTDQVEELESGLAFYRQEEKIENQAVLKLEQANSKLRERVENARGGKRSKPGKESAGERTVDAGKEGLADTDAEAMRLSMGEYMGMWNALYKRFSIPTVDGAEHIVDKERAVEKILEELNKRYKGKMEQLKDQVDTFKKRHLKKFS